MESATSELRARRASWALEDDRRLLALLRDVHEGVTSRCTAAVTRMHALHAGLDRAALALRTVGDRLHALSNTQFIESRVAEDDDVTDDVSAQTQPPAAAPPGGLSGGLAGGLVALLARHEPLALDDSSSDSDDEEVPRTILRPKDQYSHRPLPLIIGSARWKDNWHAGLLGRSSDESAEGSREDEYSEEESDEPSRAELPRHGAGAERSSTPPPPPAARAAPPRSYVTQLPYPVPLMRASPPPPDARSLSRSRSASRSDTDSESAAADYEPYSLGHKVHSSSGITRKEVEIPSKPKVIQEPSIFTETEDSDLFRDEVMKSAVVDSTSIKKPVGAVSLFGGGGAGIGAAILNRARQGSTTSDDTHEETPSVQPKPAPKSGESKDVLKDLFANANVDKSGVKVDVKTKAPVKVDSKKVDLFSDDIFDDIDDIFSSKIIVKPDKDSKVKSLFDDNDDLFSDAGVAKPDPVKSVQKQSKSIFDSDDELFSEAKDNSTTKTFSTSSKNEQIVAKVIENNATVVNNAKTSIFDSDDELFGEKEVAKPVSAITKPSFISKSKSLFADDSDSDDMFSKIKSTTTLKALVKSKSPENDSINTDVSEDSMPSRETGLKTMITSESITSDRKEPKDPVDSIKTDEFIKESETAMSETVDETENSNKTSDDAALFDNEDEDLFKPQLPETSQSSDNKEAINEQTQQSKYLVHQPDEETSDIENSIFSTTSNVNTNSDEMIPNLPNKPVLSTKFEDNEKVNPNLTAIATNIASDSEKVGPTNKNIVEDIKRAVPDAPKLTSAEFERSDFTESDEFSIGSSINNTQKDIKKDNPKMKTKIETLPTPEQVSDNSFEDIFATSAPPPIVEKSKDTKKSQNVNALFDDDSDDEAMFFKRSDAITDEKPAPLPIDKDIFSIFHDEPPAIDKDIDFVLNRDVTDNNVEAKTLSKNDIFNDAIVSTPAKISDNTDGAIPNRVEKVVGKLKPNALNINVGSLLPGAIPKKFIKEKPKDVQQKSSDIPKEPEPNLVKSVSFDGDPDSAVLDNKLSKGRPKIQIKRRPSTRRARIEAARRSAIDFDQVDAGQDAENKDPSDETPKDFENSGETPVDVYDNIEKDSVADASKKDVFKDIIDTAIVSHDYNPIETIGKTFNQKKDEIDEKTSKTVINEEKLKSEVLNINDEDIYVFKHPNVSRESSSQAAKESKDIEDTKNEIKVKQDSEIKEKSKNMKQIKNPLFDDDDDDDIFVSSVTKLAEKPKTTTHVKTSTLVQPVKGTNVAKTPLFNDLSDDESLFGAKSMLTKNPPKSALFHSDSDEELFAPKKSVLDKTLPNDSLFGDDDDDEIFGSSSTL